jgi:RNA polymerase sigma factor (sigma-70 family)
MQDSTSDQLLMQQIRQGSREGFSTLFRKYFSELLHYGIRLTQDEELTEECIQKLFVYLFEHPKTLANIETPKTYLYTSLRHQLTKELQRKQAIQRKNEKLPSSIDLQFSHEDVLIQEEEQQEQQQAIAGLLNELPIRQREAIYLKYYGSLSTREIAVVMDITPQGALNMIYKAIKKLRNSKQLKNMNRLLLLQWLPFFSYLTFVL